MGNFDRRTRPPGKDDPPQSFAAAPPGQERSFAGTDARDHETRRSLFALIILQHFRNSLVDGVLWGPKRRSTDTDFSSRRTAVHAGRRVARSRGRRRAPAVFTAEISMYDKGTRYRTCV
jgi:hypothetical protein